jgi:hypothetical protein
MNDLRVGDKMWYVDTVYNIAILVTIEEVDDYFRKQNPNSYLFYWVDEPVGHALDRDELVARCPEKVNYFDNSVTPTHLCGPFINHYGYKVGINNAMIQGNVLKTVGKRFRNRTIHEGIHVCLTKKEANTHLFGRRRVIPVKCLLSDLMGVDGGGEAVFRKIEIKQKDYDKAMDLAG